MERYKVILVDDEEEVIDVMEAKIRWNELGFEVVGSATNGVKALELIEKLHELKGNRLCQSCGEEIMMDAVYCSYCGEKQDPLEEKIQNTCKNCGWVMESEDLFCSNCGAKKE